MKNDPAVREASQRVYDIVLRHYGNRAWWAGFLISSFFLLVLLVALTVLFWWGVGIWGINIPVAWGFAIVNFVWWIGIGHAGTFISAVLYLCNQNWRNSINRLSEAMTLFAVTCAGMFPVIHLGRFWRVYWLAPYPNTMEVWPQFRSPLIWDEFAVGTYFTVSILFWYLGLVPDLAALRDTAPKRLQKIFYGVLSFGWSGSSLQWARFQAAYGILAGLATPLVVSVHSIVSTDFAAAQVPGWHNALFPPYFVAGAIFSGFAMVLTFAIPLRKFFHLEALITPDHMDKMAKVMLATGLIVAYGYIMEGFMAWYSGSQEEWQLLRFRFTGPYAVVSWLVMICNVIIPQALWLPRVRKSPLLLFILSLVINLGMWLERFVIIVTALSKDFLPSSWALFYPTFWDIATLIGSLGLFSWLFFLFIRFFPMISVHEVKKEYAEA